MVFLDELETYGKLEAKKWAHIPHVQTQAAFELSDEAFQVRWSKVIRVSKMYKIADWYSPIRSDQEEVLVEKSSRRARQFYIVLRRMRLYLYFYLRGF